MPWTKEQKKQILDQYWGIGSASCPLDGADLKIVRKNIQQVANTLLSIKCPRCLEHFDSSEIEPAAQPFDDYSIADKIAIADLIFAKETPTCPKDYADLEFSKEEYSGGWLLFVHCPRCGRTYRWDNNLDKKHRSLGINE
ncbi:MAG: hypothetical protein WBB67_09670 [bacterium]